MRRIDFGWSHRNSQRELHQETALAMMSAYHVVAPWGYPDSAVASGVGAGVASQIDAVDADASWAEAWLVVVLAM